MQNPVVVTELTCITTEPSTHHRSEHRTSIHESDSTPSLPDTVEVQQVKTSLRARDFTPTRLSKNGPKNSVPTIRILFYCKIVSRRVGTKALSSERLRCCQVVLFLFKAQQDQRRVTSHSKLTTNEQKDIVLIFAAAQAYGTLVVAWGRSSKDSMECT
ncbi:hypothetical protein FOTG_07005 [Fusarium oxysporum f. sp. vasinfectum 25433]|uniref:Uncharacterized protein n=1 Tax=Fusarium oxysporum f. sp. vasinfectum 25433 TaxID=1089449 RepID=X0LLG9_FUSOX|nr:hypothetical protein FOTG_07005 [Fusarium oxysporum f. sp. vasinfectum 25433]